MFLCKVQFSSPASGNQEELGYKTLARLVKVIFEDKELFLVYLGLSQATER